MLTTNVSALSFIAMGFAVFCGLAIPVGMLIFIKKKFQCKIMPFFTGCLSFFLFAITFEGLINFLVSTSSLSVVLAKNPFNYALYSGLMAGIFEETGRFIFMKSLIKKYPDDSTSLMYGAGHGGIEVIVFMVVAMVSNIVLGIMINTGAINDKIASLPENQLVSMQQTIISLCETKPYIYLLSIVERIGAVIFHLAASVLVWFSVKDKQQIWLFPVAIVLHALLDFFSSWLAAIGVPVVLVEVLIIVYAILVSIFALFIWKRNREVQFEYKDIF